MGEGQLAWKQLEKVLPLTHKLITTTPFVMSNSYSYNEELGLDGESMSDWFTGSANVLIKTLTREVFGIRPDLNGLNITPSAYMPFESANVSVCVKGKIVKVNYKNKRIGNREITLNGKTVGAKRNEAKQNYEIYLRTNELSEVNIIDITD